MNSKNRILAAGILILMSFSMSLIVNGMARRTNNRCRLVAPRRVAPRTNVGPGSQPAPVPRPVQENDAGIQKAIQASLNELNAPEENGLRTSEQMKQDVERLGQTLYSYPEAMNRVVNMLCRQWVDAQEVMELESEANQVLDTMQAIIENFYLANEAGDLELCIDLDQEMTAGKARLRAIEATLKDMAHRVLAVAQPETSDFPVPASLQKDGIVVRHLRTGGQKGATCGPHAAVNARAIQQILEAHQQTTSAEFLNGAAALQGYIQGQNLFDNEVYDIVQRIGLKRLFIFGYNNNRHEFYETGRSADFGAEAGVEEIFTMIKTSDISDYFFILNIGGHWVTAAIIKCPGQRTQIVYMDSGNGALAEGSVGALFIAYVQREILA